MTSGRVSTRRSLLPRRSFVWLANRAPLKSSSLRRRRWILVPMAPSSMRIRRANSSVSVWLMSSDFFLFSRPRGHGGFRAGGDEHGERIAGFARADADFHVSQSRRLQHPLQLAVVEPQGAIAELAT